MKLLDVNLLLYAVNLDGAQHTAAKVWLERVLSEDEPVALPWVVLLAFLRVSTSGRVFSRPLSAEQALETVGGWLSLPSVRVLHAGVEHWRIFKSLLAETGTGGNLTTDAHLAAMAIEHGCELCSTDTDFLRFPRLKWSNPLRSS
jgi:uncharacterized protein